MQRVGSTNRLNEAIYVYINKPVRLQIQTSARPRQCQIISIAAVERRPLPAWMPLPRNDVSVAIADRMTVLSSTGAADVIPLPSGLT